ncbi:MAG: hypothetical protein Pars2KO_31330 [Parasphingorhabdus sp.]
MSKAWVILVILLALLSIAAGIAKVMQTAEEATFFQQVGIPLSLMIAFGGLQIVGGLAAVIPMFRKWGLILIALMFLLSSVQILMAGNHIFTLVSLIPAALALITVRKLTSRP